MATKMTVRIASAAAAGGLGLLAFRFLRGRLSAGQGEEITELLRSRHDAARALMERHDGAGSEEEREGIVDELRRMLSVHESVEEQIVHPLARRVIPGGGSIVERLLQQEREAKDLLAGIERSQPGSAERTEQVTRFFAAVRQHAATEENELFPLLRLHVDATRRGRIGAAVERAESMAPTHPHPRAPSTPPGNVLLGTPVAVLDRVRDRMSRTPS